ncbi:MAG: hypothetical protein AB7V36_03480, partial [Bacteroidales bacterium]
MKSAFLISVFAFFFINVFAQVNTTILHQKTIGGAGNDNIRKIIKTNNGYIIAGNSYSGISGEKTDTCRGGSDLWLIKTDMNFNIQWQKTIGGSQDDYLADLVMTNDSGYILAAISYSPISGDKNISNFGLSDYWILKIDKSGNIIWQKTYGGVSGSYCDLSSIIRNNDNKYIIYGISNSNAGGMKSENCRGYSDLWVVCIDSIGSVYWDKTIGGNQFESSGYCILNSIDSSLVLLGSTMSSLSGDIEENSYGNFDALTVSVNSTNGQLIKQKRFGGSRDEYGICIITNSTNDYALSYSSSDISGTKTENNRGTDTLTFDYWITKLSDTTIIWDKTIGGFKDEGAKGIIAADNPNQLIIYGLSDSGTGAEKTESCRGMWDYWLVAIDTNANILWQKTFGGSSYDLPMDMLMLEHNHYVVAGSSQSPIS